MTFFVPSSTREWRLHVHDACWQIFHKNYSSQLCMRSLVIFGAIQNQKYNTASRTIFIVNIHSLILHATIIWQVIHLTINYCL